MSNIYTISDKIMSQSAVEKLVATYYAYADTFVGTSSYENLESKVKVSWARSNLRQFIQTGQAVSAMSLSNYSSQILTAPKQSVVRQVNDHNWICEALADMQTHAQSHGLTGLEKVIQKAHETVSNKLENLPS